MRFRLLLFAVTLIAPVRGHGGIYNYTIDGVDYAGHYPWLPEEGQASAQRRWWPDPIIDPNHPYLACNRGNPLPTSLPKLHVPVRAGTSVVTAWWVPPDCPRPPPPAPYPETPSVLGYGDAEPPMSCRGSEYPWPHAHGPLSAYMADCGGPCGEWDGSGRRWFKIWEAGYVATGWPGSGYDGGGGGGGVYPIASRVAWGHSHLIRRGVNVTIPDGLRPGNYLLRYEVINLERRTEFYPQCVQLEVSSDGDEVPSGDFLVGFPGAYRMDDPGLAVGGIIYKNKEMANRIFNYTMPGPRVWAPEDDYV